MDRPIHIAIYSGEIPSTTFIERLIQGLAEHGHHILLFGLQRQHITTKQNISIYSYGTNKLSKFFQLVKYSILLSIFKPQAKKKLDALLRSNSKNLRLSKMKSYPVLYHQPDIFHIQWAKSLEDWIWVQTFGVKIVLSLRGTHITISPIANPDLADMYRRYFSKIDAFHTVSNAIGLIAEQYGALPQNIKTIYSGLALNEFPFHLKTKQNHILKILSIGRSHWTKGYRTALDAMAKLKQNNIAFGYSMIGVDIDEEVMFQRTQLGLGADVKFLGALAFDEVKLAIYHADVVLLPSVEEGIANVVLEAMALGTLVVSTDCGGMKEVIIDGTNGFLVPIRAPEQLAIVLETISSLNLEEYQKITKAARKTIEQQHTIDKMITNMEFLYELVLKKRLCE